jgi:hypothetical protein
VVSELLDVANVVIHVDLVPWHPLLAGVGRAQTRGALVEQHRPMSSDVEVQACFGRGAAARTAV